MPTLHPFHLAFRTGLHIGKHGIGQEEAQAHIPADTLFAALITARTRQGDNANDWSKPPFRLTSAFPHAGKVRFFPRPVVAPKAMETDPKAWRKIKFISEGILRLWLEGKLEGHWPKPEGEKPEKGLALQHGALWLTVEEVGQLPHDFRVMKAKKDEAEKPRPLSACPRCTVWQEQAVPRVTVDRIARNSEIYHTGRVVFAPECGLWFGVEAKDCAEIETLLELLSTEGLGAERSVGYGAFQFEKQAEIVLPETTSNGLMLLLSRFSPASAAEVQALTAPGAAYELARVTGYVRSLGQADQRRKTARLVEAGSIIGASAQGDLVDVRPEKFSHPVWRYGVALGIGWKKGEGA